MHGRRADGRGARRLGAVSALALVVVCSAAPRAESVGGAEDEPTTFLLRAMRAPLPLVLGTIARDAGFRLQLGEAIDGEVDGWLDGQGDALLAALADEHALTVHREGETLWIDRRDRAVSERVPLGPALAAVAPTLLESLLGSPSDAVLADGHGVVLSGSRAFVRRGAERLAEFARIGVRHDESPPTFARAAAPAVVPAPRSSGSIGSAAPVPTSGSTAPPIAAPVPAPVPAPVAAPAPGSVSDVPGFDTEYFGD